MAVHCEWRLTWGICWALAGCSGTSGSGGRLPAPEEPWCFPSAPRLRTRYPARHVPSLIWPFHNTHTARNIHLVCTHSDIQFNLLSNLFKLLAPLEKPLTCFFLAKLFSKNEKRKEKHASDRYIDTLKIRKLRLRVPLLPLTISRVSCIWIKVKPVISDYKETKENIPSLWNSYSGMVSKFSKWLQINMAAHS